MWDTDMPPINFTIPVRNFERRIAAKDACKAHEFGLPELKIFNECPVLMAVVPTPIAAARKGSDNASRQRRNRSVCVPS